MTQKYELGPSGLVIDIFLKLNILSYITSLFFYDFFFIFLRLRNTNTVLQVLW